MKGKLYIVSTPIGNLEDITYRAIRVLREVDLVAAEDTRRTLKLFRAYEIEKPLTSVHDYNERRKSHILLDRMFSGLNVAYVSDAGTPGISDPGYVLINGAIERGIQVIPVPGPSAAVTALSVSGLPMDRFIFEGFLPSREKHRRQFLDDLVDETRTMVFYESPKRLEASLRDIAAIMGDRVVVLAREMTKVYEEIIRGNVLEVLKLLIGKTVKGEITLIVAGCSRPKAGAVGTSEDVRKCLEVIIASPGISMRDAVRQVSDRLNVPRKQVYRIAVKNFRLDPPSSV
jgi:16S rRNA (cytidine1402-2'-O)-methyltransferase